MNHNIKHRREKITDIVQKLEDAMELLIGFKKSEKDYNEVVNLHYAEVQLDECIAFINRHEDEYLN